MEEFGIPILHYLVDTWEYDCAQLIECDCLSANINEILLKNLFFGPHFELNAAHLKRDFSVCIAAGLEEAALQITQGVDYGFRGVFYQTECAELWALLEMGMFERHLESIQLKVGSALIQTGFSHRPLRRACMEGDQQLVDRLLELGAQFDTTAIDGGFVSLLDEENINMAMLADTVRRSGRDLNRALVYCCHLVQKERVRKLLAAGANVHGQDHIGQTALEALRDGIDK